LNKPVYKRVLLKLSGEALAGEKEYGIDPVVVQQISEDIRDVQKAGVGIAVVIGGGNIFRGLAASARGMDRVTADYVGMLATVMNSLVLQDSLEKIGVHTRVQSAIEIKQLAESFIRRRAIRHLEKERAVIFAAGTGNPYFTTDTAAVLRAIEIEAQVVLKATKVDGVYDRDPVKDRAAKRFDQLTYMDVLQRQLKVMDATAISLCSENHLPIIVFNMKGKNNLRRVIQGEAIGTVIKE